MQWSPARRGLNLSIISWVMVLFFLFIVGGRYAVVQEKIKETGLTLGAPLLKMVDAPSRLLRWISVSVSSKQTLLSENVALRSKVLMLQAEVQKLTTQQHESRSLRNLLKAPSDSFSKVMAARLLSVATNPYRKLIVLNKGRDDGVFVNQAVLDDKGIVGQVIEVGPITSVVLLLSDSQSIIPVKFSRTGTRGFLIGNGQDLEVIDLPKTTELNVGDTLISSGLAQRYPKGYPVGTVESIEKSPSESFLKVKVKPAAGLSSSELFLLVWPSNKQSALRKQFEQRYTKPTVTRSSKE